VSRLFPEHLLVRLSPAEVQVGPARQACDPAFGAEPWHGALEALKGIAWPRSRVTVVLSNHFVRYALVPWSDAIANAAEEQAYLRHHFAKIHGERAKGWQLRASEAPKGAPRLASAVDSALVDAIRASSTAPDTPFRPPAPGWSLRRPSARASRCTRPAPSMPCRTAAATGARCSNVSATASRATHPLWH